MRLHDPAGLPLGYACRRLDPHEIQIYGKWKLPSRLPKYQILYNLHRIARADSRGIVLVECPWSVMRIHQIGLSAVALLGTALSAHQQRLLYSLHPRRLILFLDGDDAGRAASARLFATLRPILPAFQVHLPPNLDPDDLPNSDLADLLHPILGR
ncbi:MAG: toprim domain-containing protein [Acidobacteria bacterium]|nr:toprim domain-containing protein [Acidobacteriota bacterium]